MTQTYTQCKMSRDANVEYVAWIPSKFAVVGKKITIEGKDGTWQVVERYSSKDAKYVEECSRDYLRQREASDI